MAEKTAYIKQPRPVKLEDNVIRFCPRCGQEDMSLVQHTLEPIPPYYLLSYCFGYECGSCGLFITGTHLGLSWLEV